MKRIFALMLAAIPLITATGCQAASKLQPSPKPEIAPAPVEEPPAVPSADSSPQPEQPISQSGPYGTISLTLPEGWDYQLCDMNSGELTCGLYGIRIHPERCPGAVEVCYVDNFGVCGTGLVTEQMTLAGQSVEIGTYDNHDFWDYVAFQENGIVALRDEDCGLYWDEAQRSQLMEILDSVTFDSKVREGCIGFYMPDATADKIALELSLRNVTPSGAVLVFDQYDAALPTGTLEFGEAFLLEKQDDYGWNAVDLQGDYGYQDIAFSIALEDTTEHEVDWSPIYGTLSPGTYRIRKQVMDFRSGGDYDTYDLAACFIVSET